MKIVFVTATLGAGGAERVIVHLAGFWAESGDDVTILSLSSADDFYQPHPRVRRVRLPERAAPRSRVVNNLRRVAALRRELRAQRPDVVIAFIDAVNVLTLLATRGLGIRVIVSERTNPSQHQIGMIWDGLRRAVYWLAAAVVVQTEAVRPWAARLPGVHRVEVIANPVVPPKVAMSRPRDLPPGPFIMGMGRLAPVKGFDILIHAFASIAAKFPEWSLVLVGEGPLQAELEALSIALGVGARVLFLGKLRDPFPTLQHAELFVLSSRYEGFPNVLVEAMAAGVAVIATDCPSGPAEIVRTGLDGILISVDDTAALSIVLGELMGNPERRQRLGSAGREAIRRYDLASVAAAWRKIMTSSPSRH